MKQHNSNPSVPHYTGTIITDIHMNGSIPVKYSRLDRSNWFCCDFTDPLYLI